MLDKLFDWFQELDPSLERGLDGFPIQPNDPHYDGHRMIEACLARVLVHKTRPPAGLARLVFSPYWSYDAAQLKETVQTVRADDEALQRHVVHALTARILFLAHILASGRRSADNTQKTAQCFQIHTLLLTRLLGGRLPLRDDDLVSVLRAIGAVSEPHAQAYPMIPLLAFLERHTGAHGATSVLRLALTRFRERLRRLGWDDDWAGAPVTHRLDVLLAELGTIAPGETGIDAILHDLGPMDEAPKTAWRALLQHAATATSARPSQTWGKQARRLLDAVGDAAFGQHVPPWLEKAEAREDFTEIPRNADQMRGLIWLCSLLDDAEVARVVGTLGLAYYKKIPNIGPRSVKVGNACIYTLGAMAGREPIGQLTRLRMRIKDRRGLKAIDTALDAAAAREGLTPDDLEEIAVPTYGLDDGALRQNFGDYTAELRITGTNGTTLTWIRPDGKRQKSVPAAVKREHAEALKALRRTAKDLRAMLVAQRNRLERFFLHDRAWTPAAWREHYLDHPLLRVLARRLIWQVTHEGRITLATWHDGQLIDREDQPLGALPEAAQVRLWHPIDAEVATVQAWRRWLDQHAVTQPFKQAHREVYLLTDAERQTGTYSNRFAAHILHQHQLHALCQARGWRYHLQGAFDSCNVPMLELPRWGLRIAFDVAAPFDVADPFGSDLTTEMGIYRYVSTDQVRFHALEEGRVFEALPLETVPPVVFSEVMRDVDLFVGVCSIGNDPTWMDSGEAGLHGHFAGYWQAYAFGDLSATAQTRKAVLATLLPRLAIADRCRLNGRFLVVQGELRTYKIHLRSANILMEPNDQYLCIVPDGRAAASRKAGSLFLPFEGDRTLSLILSKALLLANDTAIDDPTIMRQIKRT